MEGIFSVMPFSILPMMYRNEWSKMSRAWVVHHHPWYTFLLFRCCAVGGWRLFEAQCWWRTTIPTPTSVSNAFIWKINENVWHSHRERTHNTLYSTLYISIRMMYNMAHEKPHEPQFNCSILWGSGLVSLRLLSVPGFLSLCVSFYSVLLVGRMVMNTWTLELKWNVSAARREIEAWIKPLTPSPFFDFTFVLLLRPLMNFFLSQNSTCVHIFSSLCLRPK